MTRQIALGAVIAFAVTVLALSVWEPKAVIPPAPVPAVVVAPAPAPAPLPAIKKPFRTESFRPTMLNSSIRSPVIMMQVADAGSP